METKNEFQEPHTKAKNNTTGDMDYVINCFTFLLDVQVAEFEAVFNRKVTSDELLKIKLIASNLTSALVQSNLKDFL